VTVGPEPRPAQATRLRAGKDWITLSTPLEFDQSLKSSSQLHELEASGVRSPWLTSRPAGRGRLLVWNLRTFSEADFRETGEHLLSPKPLGITDLPRPALDELRRLLLAPAGLSFSAPARVGLYAFDGLTCLYNFRDEAVETQFNGSPWKLAANAISCRP
jgi:hypothetical protein